MSQLGLVLGTGAGAGAVAVAPASASLSPVAPRPLINIAAGLVFGVILGVALAGLADALRRRRARREAAPDTTVPVLGSVSVPPLAQELTAADRAAFDAIASTVWQRAAGRSETIVGVVGEVDLADRGDGHTRAGPVRAPAGRGRAARRRRLRGEAPVGLAGARELGGPRRPARTPAPPIPRCQATRGLAFLPAGQAPAKGGARSCRSCDACSRRSRQDTSWCW